MKRNKFRKIASNLTTLVLIGIIFCCILYLGKYMHYKYSIQQDISEMSTLQKEMKEKIEENKDKETDGKGEDKNFTDTRTEVKERKTLPEYQKLKEEYPDMYGRIQIEGLKANNEDFNYLVMFTPDDSNFYEDKNWKGEKVSVGTSIWIDGRTTEETENIIIYGHNFKNQSMFGVLKNFKDEGFYKKHKYILFDTLYEKSTYEIICVSESKVYYEEVPSNEYLFYKHIELDAKEEFDEYIKDAKENACFNIETTAEYGDQLITLCTCDYATKDGRLLIVAKKV